MGLTFIDGKVKAGASKEVSVRFLVDSGVSLTLLANEHWKELGLTPKRTMEFTLADGEVIKRNVSECYIILPVGEGHTPVILGEEGDTPLLGIITLEILGLKLNPFQRTLEPMKMMLA